MSQDTEPTPRLSEGNGLTSSDHDQRFADIVESTTLDDCTQDAVLVGEPYDGGVVDRPGAREGPAAIRAALADLRTHHFDAGPVASVGDLGTVDVPAGESVSDVQARVREVAAAVHDTDAVPVFLGGDGSLTVANVAPLLTREIPDGGYVTDGGFGEDDDEDVGEVEHFDPTGGAASEDDGEDDDEEDDAETVAVEEEIVGGDGSADESEPGQSTGEDDTADGADEEADESEAADDGDSDDGADESNDEQVDGEETESEDEGEDESESDDSGENQSEGDDGEEDEDESESQDEDESEDETEGDDAPGEVETIEAPAVEREATDAEASAEATASGETVGVVSLDAHLDCRAVDGQPSNATAYRELFDAGLDSLAVLGARHFESSTSEAEYIREQGGTIVTAEEVGEDPVVAADRALDALGDVDAVYVSVDLDVLDSTAAPGVSTPSPGGIATRELFRLLRVLASDERLAGLELVEAAPPLCPDGRTARAGARAVAHALSVAGDGPTRT